MFGGAPNTKYYEILGVSKNALQDDLKNAFTKAVFQSKELAQAYEVLSNPVKRQLYDRYGVDGLRQWEVRDAFLHLMVSLEDLYNDPEKRELFDRQMQDSVFPLMVSLEDLCKGKSKKKRLSLFAIFSKCKGKGSKSSAIVPL